MKIVLTLCLFITFTSTWSQVYWSTSGANITSGRVEISGTGTPQDFDDIIIDRNEGSAGMRIFNSNLSGRSVVLFGNAYGGKYGFVAHHGQSYNGGTGFTQVYKPSSTILVGADVNGLGLISTSDIRFNAGGDGDSNIRMVVNANGNVGIGVTSANSKLEIMGDTPGAILTMQSKDINAHMKFGVNATYPWLQSYMSPLRINELGNDVYFNVNGGNVGIGTAAASSQLHIASNANHAFTISRVNGQYGFRILRDAAAGNVSFQIGTGASTWETKIKIGEGEGANTKLIFNPDGGNVLIGKATQVNSSYILDVNGKIRSNEIVVNTNGADFVFEENYQLGTLEEVEKYIKENKHLPDIESAETMQKDGLNVGDMNVKLLQKIEEMTLYMIEFKKEMKELKQVNEKLQAEVDQLKSGNETTK